MQVGKNKNGFTIVELLIVIVVIGILAAITIVAFNGVTKRANTAAVQSEIEQNAKTIMAAAAINGQYSNIDVMTPSTVSLKFNASRYKVLSYCSTATSFVLAGQTTTGDKFYANSNSTVIADNSIDAFLPCGTNTLSTYLNLPTACGTENTTCTFSGTATVVYGSTAQGQFYRLLNQVSSINCSNATFGDPASGFSKACYLYPN
jgi:prepilin-type N-terminal cleavage/methylation domain-containing protein